MGFKNEYVWYSDCSGYVKNEKTTILGFWGFNFSKHSESRSKTSSDKIVIESNGDNSYNVRKQKGYTTTEQVECSQFKRDISPVGKEKELEDRFYDLIENKYVEKTSTGKTNFSINKTPYLFKSVEEFYNDDYGWLDKWGTIIFGVIPIVFLAVLNAFITGEKWMSGLFTILFPGIGWVIAVFLIFHLINKFATYLMKTVLFPYDKLSHKKKEKIREKYLNSLDVGIDEANAILREYAILKGYDKI